MTVITDDKMLMQFHETDNHILTHFQAWGHSDITSWSIQEYPGT